MSTSSPKNVDGLTHEEAHSLANLRKSDRIDVKLIELLASVVGGANVVSDFDERAEYAQDKLPYAKFRVRSGSVVATVPSAIVRPKDAHEVSAIIKLVQREGIRIIPVGGGSGVLGGTVPLAHEVMLDLTRLSKVADLNVTDGTVSVQAGMFGGELESVLNEAGWTCGHFPQSMLISTVGGWAACRGGGQASSRYGKIEDIVTGIEVVLPDGKLIRVKSAPRRAVGPSVIDIFVGCEGTLGIITEVTLRIWRLPEVDIPLCCAFPDLESALLSARQIMQAELRPEILRIYDAAETQLRDEGNNEFSTHPYMGMLSFCGLKNLAQVERDEALSIIERNGGIISSEEPYRKWRENRYVSLSDKWTTEGWFMDTIEVTVPWSRVLDFYSRVETEVRSIHKDIFFGAHWSHAYPDGVCQYMTFRLPPMPDAEALPLHSKVWDSVQQTILDCGGSISHHHGIGIFRGRWMAKEHGDVLQIFQKLKDALDPKNLINPGKLGLLAPSDALVVPQEQEGSKA
ncbi:MAG: FAD-binding oxidoreductase [Rhizobiaceae bacterium]|nr:FAD-binding oxidoreductase [Rhizobiaceae bacterium]